MFAHLDDVHVASLLDRTRGLGSNFTQGKPGCGIAAERVPLMWSGRGSLEPSGHQNLGHSDRVARVRAQHRPAEVLGRRGPMLCR